MLSDINDSIGFIVLLSLQVALKMGNAELNQVGIGS
jgi:hypothetical protein